MTIFYGPFITFALAAAIFHIVFIWIVKLEKPGWKITEYFWLGLTLVGFVGVVKKTNIEIEENRLRYETKSMHVYKSRATESILNAIPSLFCLEFTKSEWSPKNFDQRVMIMKENCRRANEYAVSLKKDSLNLDSIPDFIGIDNEEMFMASYLREMHKMAQDYNKEIPNYTSIKMSAEKDYSYFAIQNLSLYLLAVGFGLRFARATGEYILETKPKSLK